MEKITFNIFKESDTMCRITSNDIRSCYREIAGGGCITNINVLLADMIRITNEVKEKYGNEAVFQVINMMV